jgi:hypothetical protein
MNKTRNHCRAINFLPQHEAGEGANREEWKRQITCEPGRNADREQIETHVEETGNTWQDQGAIVCEHGAS